MANLNVEVSVKGIPEVLEMLTSLSTEVAGLKRQLAELKQASEATSVEPKQLTRAAVVKRAIADVAELTNLMKDGRRKYVGNTTLQRVATIPEFHVNREKCTVVVLVKGCYSDVLYERGIAKCTPDDVFNEYIGKAIALRRALGLTVPDEYLNAPKPEGKKAGDIIVLPSGERKLLVTHLPKYGECQPGSINARLGTLIDDSARAEYTS